MRLTTVVLMLSCAGTLAASPRSLPGRLAVHLTVATGPGFTSPRLRTVTENEAAAIWREYGVDLRWTDEGTPADLTVDVFVERRGRHVSLDGPPPVLGWVTLAADDTARVSIHISLDAIESLLEIYAAELFHEAHIASALGRVLAHELGHVLLGRPSYHDPEGLMRASFVSSDLVRPDRSPFRLSPRSVERLRARIPLLTEGQAVAPTNASVIR
jgi:hypothetical protein